MSKIAISLLVLLAFFYALWLVAARRRLPDPGRVRGLRRRLVLGSLLFVGLLQGGACKTDQQKKPVAKPSEPPATAPASRPASTGDVLSTIKAVWRTLDPARGKELRQKLEAAAREGAVRPKVADMLATAFAEIAAHRVRTRSDGARAKCYDMTRMGAALMTSREQALQQIELLRKARASGTIDDQTARKAHAALAREVEMLHRATGLMRTGPLPERLRLIKLYKDKKVAAGDAASVAAAMIVKLEDGPDPQTPARRLTAMKKGVEALFQKGPPGNDWEDPDINPNVRKILKAAGLIADQTMVSCYDREASPVAARSAELLELQKKVLDRSVKAGVLPVEVAGKAATATRREGQGDHATQKDVAAYQKNVRRVTRLLYRRGELPSAFVRELERAADVEMIDFNGSRALRNDVGYHLRSNLYQPVGHAALEQLRKRKLVPPARGLRLVFDWGPGRKKLSATDNKKIANLGAMLDSSATIKLPGDAAAAKKEWTRPADDVDYRWKVRRAVRALIKLGLARAGSVKHLEQLIGIPIHGAFKK